MVKIPTIKEMENFLLRDSKTSDLVAAGDTKAKSPDTMLTAKQVRHEVSVFARVLINVYCGWPFHDEILKRYEKLNLAPYKGFINPWLKPVTDAEGRITDISIDYTESYDHQLVRYSTDYGTLI